MSCLYFKCSIATHAQGQSGSRMFTSLYKSSIGEHRSEAILCLIFSEMILTFVCFLLLFLTNYQKHAGLKQQRLVLSWFWRPEVPNQFHWVEINTWAGPHSVGRNLFLSSHNFRWLPTCLTVERNVSISA